MSKTTHKLPLEVPYREFVSKLLPLYSGPHVTIDILPANKRYTLLKDLICTQSPYFKALFDGDFQEGQTQALTLAEEEGVISIQSFEMLIQWLYTGQVFGGNFSGPNIGKQKISSILGFLRIADMCGVSGMELAMADQIRSIITDTPTDPRSGLLGNGDPSVITSQHTRAALFLPSRHPVRDLVVNEAIECQILLDSCWVLKAYQGAQPDKVQILRNSRAESFLADLVGEG